MSLESSERIRKQQKELISILQKSHSTDINHSSISHIASKLNPKTDELSYISHQSRELNPYDLNETNNYNNSVENSSIYSNGSYSSSKMKKSNDPKAR